MGPLMADVAPGLAPGELIVRDGQRLHRLYAVNAAGKTWVFHDGVTYEIGEDAPARKRPGAHETLTAPMPATVIKVTVRQGDRVRRGDVLVLLEAMKMELPLRSPSDGTVSAINCRDGELVQPGTPLIELE